MERFQHSIAREARCTGIGLHSGAPVTLTLLPGEPGSGILFGRTDLPGPVELFPARYDRVTDTKLGTTVTNEDGNIRIATVEHLLAALAGLGVDNAILLLDGPEVPILDGSSAPFVALIEKAGLTAQAAPRRYLEILAPLKVEAHGGWIEFTPLHGFRLDVAIDFAHKAIKHQQTHFILKNGQFARQLAKARTFGFAHEVAWLQANGLARGGSLENAIVLNDAGVMNEEGLRYPDEFARHKALDLIGDFALAGYPLLGNVRAFRPGHGVNNHALRTLFTAKEKWRITTLKAPESTSVVRATGMVAGHLALATGN